MNDDERARVLRGIRIAALIELAALALAVPVAIYVSPLVAVVAVVGFWILLLALGGR